MNEAYINSDNSHSKFEQDIWDDFAFERKVRQKISLEEKKEFINYFQTRGGKSEFDGYKIFATEVADDPGQAYTHEQLISQIPNLIDLGTYQLNGLDYQRDERQREQLEGIDLSVSPIAYSSDSTFTYIHYYGNHELEDSREIAEEISGRFYLCPEFDELPDILPKLIEKYQEKDLRLIAKFSKISARNDRMVLYCDKESIATQLEALKELKEENPELFQNLGRNRLWGEIEGVEGIYYGQENPYAKFSYSEDRAMAVGMAATALESIQASGTEINDEIIEAVFDLSTLSRRIDPESWSEYIKDEDREQMAGQAEDIIAAITDPEELEYIGEEIDLHSFINIFSGLRFLLGPKERKIIKK